ncbi:hypothetical protein DRJ22_00995 [Candidatus Woesearchaeota archaeon]|nr:MAG: hypothetical protein DRJ22_00995 [Candidatus Woesearchaeota archaeon]
MKKRIIYGLLIIILSMGVFAKVGQLDWSITDLRCGNGVRDKYELYDAGDNDTLCDEYGKLLGIAAVGDEYHCTCLPRIIPAFCGNDIREGAELCDGSAAEDFCPELGEIMGVKLKCNPKTCGCDFVEEIPESYNPEYIEMLENLTKIKAVCGDKKVQGLEDCDPPKSLCKTNTGKIGECNSECKCVEKNFLEETSETNKENKTDETKENNATKENNTKEITIKETNKENMTKNSTEKETTKEKPGFFKRIWQWIIDLFS